MSSNHVLSPATYLVKWEKKTFEVFINCNGMTCSTVKLFFVLFFYLMLRLVTSTHTLQTHAKESLLAEPCCLEIWKPEQKISCKESQRVWIHHITNLEGIIHKFWIHSLKKQQPKKPKTWLLPHIGVCPFHCHSVLLLTEHQPEEY